MYLRTIGKALPFSFAVELRLPTLTVPVAIQKKNKN